MDRNSMNMMSTTNDCQGLPHQLRMCDACWCMILQRHSWKSRRSGVTRRFQHTYSHSPATTPSAVIQGQVRQCHWTVAIADMTSYGGL